MLTIKYPFNKDECNQISYIIKKYELNTLRKEVLDELNKYDDRLKDYQIKLIISNIERDMNRKKENITKQYNDRIMSIRIQYEKNINEFNNICQMKKEMEMKKIVDDYEKNRIELYKKVRYEEKKLFVIEEEIIKTKEEVIEDVKKIIYEDESNKCLNNKEQKEQIEDINSIKINYKKRCKCGKVLKKEKWIRSNLILSKKPQYKNLNSDDKCNDQCCENDDKKCKNCGRYWQKEECPTCDSKTKAHKMKCEYCNVEYSSKWIHSHYKECKIKQVIKDPLNKNKKQFNCFQCKLPMLRKSLMRHLPVCKGDNKIESEECIHCKKRYLIILKDQHSCNEDDIDNIRCIRCNKIFKIDTIMDHQSKCKVISGIQRYRLGKQKNKKEYMRLYNNLKISCQFCRKSITYKNRYRHMMKCIYVKIYICFCSKWIKKYLSNKYKDFINKKYNENNELIPIFLKNVDLNDLKNEKIEFPFYMMDNNQHKLCNKKRLRNDDNNNNNNKTKSTKIELRRIMNEIEESYNKKMNQMLLNDNFLKETDKSEINKIEDMMKKYNINTNDYIDIMNNKKIIWNGKLVKWGFYEYINALNKIELDTIESDTKNHINYDSGDEIIISNTPKKNKIFDNFQVSINRINLSSDDKSTSLFNSNNKYY